MTTNPGWYESEEPGWLRYWDGISWTRDYTPNPYSHLMALDSASDSNVDVVARRQYETAPAHANDDRSRGPGHLLQPALGSAHQTTLRRLSDYERLAGILWICLGVLQILLVITAIAGAWNIIVGITRISLSSQVRDGRESIPARYEGLGGYVVIGIVNVLFGAFVGVLLVGVDLFVRDQVLKNRHLFVAPGPTAAPSEWTGRTDVIPRGAEE